jgi:hypothetical protein
MAMIASTTLLHHLTVVAGNTQAFASLGLPLLDPFIEPGQS